MLTETGTRLAFATPCVGLFRLGFTAVAVVSQTVWSDLLYLGVSPPENFPCRITCKKHKIEALSLKSLYSRTLRKNRIIHMEERTTTSAVFGHNPLFISIILSPVQY